MVALFDVGGTELLLILGAALVLLGPKRLPEIARQLGKVSNQLRDANRELKRELYSNLETPPAVGTPDSGIPAPRPAARHIEEGAAAALPAAAQADYDAPYRDAEAELQRARAAPAAAEAATGEAAPTPPAKAEADPDASGSAS